MGETSEEKGERNEYYEQGEPKEIIVVRACHDLGGEVELLI